MVAVIAVGKLAETIGRCGEGSTKCFVPSRNPNELGKVGTLGTYLKW